MALGESVVAVIDIAPESTVRAVLRALCAEDDLMVCIAKLLAKLPLDVESEDDQPAEQSGSGSTYAPAQGHWSGSGGDSSRQGKRKAVQMEICVQCESSFEEGDESLTYDMEIDYEGDLWPDWPDYVPIEDSDYCREQNPNGFIFHCCGEQGSSVDEGCTMGKLSIYGSRVIRLVFLRIPHLVKRNH
ncbi:hypothetical protein N0V85_006873 [Neurospora sp. IMI 360204]|nr:hypothetical protein N0V85_006873 [Neurospora sp. IMI 360204]